ncbi:MAG: DUF1501 domain-containing protein [Planctomycetaceae bacterium]
MNISRRDMLRLTSCGALGLSMSNWFPQFAQAAAQDPKRKRACILLWMSGGPSQRDTFDPKPDHENGGEFKPIDTSVPGIQISEHLPTIAKQMDDLAIVRSMATKEGDHTRATYMMRTGYLPQGPVAYPTMGSFISQRLGTSDAELPNYVSIAPNRFLSPAAFSPGFLGPKHTALVVGDNGRPVPQDADAADSLRVRNLKLPNGITREQADARLGLLAGLEEGFIESRPSVPGQSHRESYLQAVKMMRSDAVKAFTLDEEKDTLRDAYGRNQFGQGCLLARRLVERGVPFVEVSLRGVEANGGLGWDTHQDNFEAVKGLSGVLDPAFGTLMTDLKDRGLLDTTTVVWMGEFGRTPNINDNGGRDHWPGSWTTVVGGGGIKGGQVYGATEKDGVKVAKDPVSVPNFMATVCNALGLDHTDTNISNVGRPIPLSDHDSEPIEELLA